MTRLIKAFGYSMQGLRAAMQQAPFKAELVAAAIMIPLGIALGETGVERALLLGSVLLVPIIELLNSAVEATIDRISLERHELSGRAKDLGSAAVLVGIINAGVIWLAVLW